MPIYEYQCSVCDHHFDVMQKLSDAPETICPKCSKETVVRLVSAAGFQLKGTGWYVTDFKNNTGKKSPETTATSTITTTATETKTSAVKTTTTKDLST